MPGFPSRSVLSPAAPQHNVRDRRERIRDANQAEEKADAVHHQSHRPHSRRVFLLLLRRTRDPENECLIAVVMEWPAIMYYPEK